MGVKKGIGSIKLQQQRLYSSTLRNIAGLKAKLNIIDDCALFLNPDTDIRVKLLQIDLDMLEHSIKEDYAANKDQIKNED